MKIVEFMSGLQLPITNEEADLIDKFKDTSLLIDKKTLTEREQVIANQLVNKGLLVRHNDDGQIKYRRQINH